MQGDEELKKEEGVASPYVPGSEEVAPVIPPPTEFDYNAYQDNTTVKAMVQILQCFGRNAELLAHKHDTPNEVLIKNMDKVASEIMNIMIDCKVPLPDNQKLSDELTSIPFQIFTIISKQVGKWETQLLARYIGVRDLGNNKYRKEFASIGDLFLALKKLIKDQGDNPFDYFVEVPEDVKDDTTK